MKKETEMNTLVWKDKTSYSRGVKERDPSILELDIEGIRIVVHRILHFEGWYLTVYDLQIENHPLTSEELEGAKIEGLKIIIDELKELNRIADKLITAIK